MKAIILAALAVSLAGCATTPPPTRAEHGLGALPAQILDLLEDALPVSASLSLPKAAYDGNADVVRQLIEAGADVNYRQRHDTPTPIHWAAKQGHADVVRLLIEAGADVSAEETAGEFTRMTPLHWAASGHADVVRLLIEAGADVNAMTILGTPLHLAVAEDNADVVRLLIEAGADVNRETLTFTLIEYAVSKGYEDIARMLYRAGARQ